MTPTQPQMTAALACAPDMPPRPAVTNTRPVAIIVLDGEQNNGKILIYKWSFVLILLTDDEKFQLSYTVQKGNLTLDQLKNIL